MQILLTNDDGVHAPGLHAAARVASKFGRVVICAPDRERSACAHAMTLRDPLRVKPVQLDWEAYEVNGLPADCVNLAMCEFFPDGCDLVISGINPGPNLGWDVTYSGTVGGALEGTINGVQSVAISCAMFVDAGVVHIETASAWLEEWLPWLSKAPIPEHCILNVNVPNIALPEIQGTKITRLGKRVYQDRVEKRTDPWGRTYFWQGGVVVMDSKETGTDVQAVNDGFVSVTPVQMDWTDHKVIDTLSASIK